jgi:hypothetical protein
VAAACTVLEVIRYRVLGPLEVAVDGQRLRLGSAHQRVLLAVLLVAAGEPVSTDRLIDALTNRLQMVKLPGALEVLQIELIGLTGVQARQQSLLDARPKQFQRIRDAAQQLKQRYGESLIYRVVETEVWSRIPERRYALINFEP